MSQLASAFGLPAAEVAPCADLWAAGDYGSFWTRLRRYEVAPGFAYSGTVIDLLVEFLRERGLPVPLNLSDDGVRALSSCGVVACATPSEAAAAAAALAGFAPPAGELFAFWENWYGERDAVAEDALRAGIAWVAQVWTSGRSDWTLICVG